MFNIENLEKIKEVAPHVQIVAVSKFASVNDIFSAYYAGVKHFGESKVQHLIEKSKEINSIGNNEDLCWHFIGRLQSNKIKQLFTVSNLKYIHSVDSLKLLKELYQKQALLNQNKVKFFLQINTSLEKEKGGVIDRDSLFEMINYILSQKKAQLEFIGLMTISRLRSCDFAKDADECFLKLTNYKKEIERTFPISSLKLSMGMSQDYHIAVKYGTDFLRIGSALFENH
ncbi:MAG: YggS family pyridoxal phosphate enzyme [Bdellovibrionales bacterium RIFOXYB1_FULL_37_110]|nr:MAG: YggS family pyridoxal phosphate enzyme [Bdellovibrionales bacterium RIFOXYA1_FULL_38_20]OFZ50169.1 MAG: YggS family pyridoxal phosphate enzyme [Bdellovibrionales bacterium RIFOXYC1_FULL_37_79]OFZ57606.1 MAG: YggS family pyridoxal phosphate enzyme [Bdellovibrionales bacterium RIFOXYB1_FULL_37_110]OFZ61326.1 MAG: YggS family pyridoxal phosphate enzyme [Bdellovibrionales bacterium RIFOXYB2_FULL_36_6]OFZ61373.1 MAG: YggS family pyridoxal phosphate enzyme [Bdellovibrionales bacterium RIFOXYD